MKITMTLVCASVLLAACAAPPADTKPGEKLAADDRYVPTGTLFSKKDPKRTDATKVTSGEDLERVLRESGGFSNPNGKM